MKLNIAIIPDEVITQYKLSDIADKYGWVYIKICKGMYGLKQAGIIANQELQKHLKPFGYHPVKHTPGLWTHDSADTVFSLVVDDFAIKYTSLARANHLLSALRTKYEISVDWAASLYIGISLHWDYKACTVDLSMPDYVCKALLRFQHICTKPTLSPHGHTAPVYGAKVQYTGNALVEDPLKFTVSKQKKPC